MICLNPRTSYEKMSFLSEVLKAVQDGTVESTENNLNAITKKLSRYKENVTAFIEDMHKKYSQWPTSQEKTLRNVINLCQEIEDLKSRMNDVFNDDIKPECARISRLKEELEESKITCHILSIIIEIHEKLLCVQDLKEERNYIQVESLLKDIDCLFSKLPKEPRKEQLGDVIDVLSKSTIKNKISYYHVVVQDLNELLVMKEGKNGVLQTNSLKVAKSDQLQNIFSSLVNSSLLNNQLKKFSIFFWNRICKQILTHVTNVHKEDEEDFWILVISVKKTQMCHSYKKAFERLLDVFNFLHSHLNFVLNDDHNVLSYLGKELQADFAELLLKDYVDGPIPNNDIDRIKYKQAIDDIQDFEIKLVELGFLNKEKNPLLQHVTDMNNLIANKQCEQFSAQAIAIMKKDLHGMVKVGVHCDAANHLMGDQFPQCYVSKSCIELLTLAKDMLQKALKEPDCFATRIICSMQSIFYQYGSIVNAHHEKYLMNIPQQVVLFRNNCMYLAHELGQLNELYDKRFPKEVLPIPPIFKDQPHQLRTVGGDIFLGYIEMYIKSTDQILSEYKIESEHLSKVMCVDANKSVRQCLHQCELLRTVWHKILPHPVYNKTLGYFLNTFCKRMIDTVVNASDILVVNCKHLIEMFKIISVRGPKLFTDPDEVNLYVELWPKLNELVFILSANLAQITDGWEQGQLSAQFTSEEVKHLIHALFQNTDCREQALNRIVNN
ncbi:hypothetical protein FQR65_LT14386 [Abscondita terminalis]|nr:hypothetical protein FQR65_LT14386 [Abscondita terminalis]